MNIEDALLIADITRACARGERSNLRIRRSDSVKRSMRRAV